VATRSLHLSWALQRAVASVAVDLERRVSNV
jgi:hypothetical protein